MTGVSGAGRIDDEDTWNSESGEDDGDGPRCEDEVELHPHTVDHLRHLVVDGDGPPWTISVILLQMKLLEST